MYCVTLITNWPGPIRFPFTVHVLPLIPFAFIEVHYEEVEFHKKDSAENIGFIAPGT